MGKRRNKKSEDKNTELSTAKVLFVIALMELIEKLLNLIGKLIDKS